MMRQDKEQETVLITGTTSGIGSALTELYRQRNRLVIAVNRRVVPEEGPSIRHFKCDITSAEQVRRLVDTLIAAKLMPTIWILNAGINEVDNGESLKTEILQRVMSVNLNGNLNFIQAIQERKLKKQVIVTISSTSASVPNSGNLGYFISKLSLIKLFKIFNLIDPDNLYKVVVLGPTASNLNKDLPAMQGIQKSIFSFLSLTSEEAASKIAAFAKSSAKTLHPSVKARVFYVLLSLAVKIFPGIYYKPYSGPKEESHAR